jgi:type IV secretion system protein VirD4
MVSRQETARPLLTPGEVMQLPPDDELVLVSGCHPIRAKKARYYEDPQLRTRILPPPKPSRSADSASRSPATRPAHSDDWAELTVAAPPVQADDPDNAGIRPEHEEIAPEPRQPAQEFELADDDADDAPQRLRVLQGQVRTIARQVSLDPADDMGL